MIKIQYEVRNHNGQNSYGEWIDSDDFRDARPDHAEFIDCAIIEDDFAGGDIEVSGTHYLVRLPE